MCTYIDKDDICKLLLPQQNLISEHNNEEIYYERMTDELLRYGRIRQFIFKPQSFISFQKIGYNLRNDEIILLDTLLVGGVDAKGEIDTSSKGYFDGLVPIYDNPYLKQKKTVENAYPNKMEISPIKKFLWRDETKVIKDPQGKCGKWYKKVPGAEWDKLLPEKQEFTSIRFKKDIHLFLEFYSTYY